MLMGFRVCGLLWEGFSSDILGVYKDTWGCLKGSRGQQFLVEI